MTVRTIAGRNRFVCSCLLVPAGRPPALKMCMEMLQVNILLILLTTANSGKYRTQRTRSLSGGPATDGNNVTNAEIYRIITQQLLSGLTVWRVKMFNDRMFVERTRRSYWLGDRYYRMDNDYYWTSRETCAYRMNNTEREKLLYEDGTPIFDIIYQ
ncbi:hypothetical protein DICVIV_11415 [Dictyocaulus viviparus]|uniref:Uncharacterized protein n=1 Tax=Dictyocaulus viviparus TaxID=29172 RepID=A0A0D8XFS4_DICVI|nr:hypothetical protein DICVIV_11415 [Dictyocaulus viviparus]